MELNEGSFKWLWHGGSLASISEVGGAVSQGSLDQWWQMGPAAGAVAAGDTDLGAYTHSKN